MSAIKAAFATNLWRRRQFDGLVRAARVLLVAGCQRIYVDGSYVSGKPIPGDYDVCWVVDGVDRQLLDGVLVDVTQHGRQEQKARYGGEFFPAHYVEEASGLAFLEFFQREPRRGGRKGILQVELAGDPVIT